MRHTAINSILHGIFEVKIVQNDQRAQLSMVITKFILHVFNAIFFSSLVPIYLSRSQSNRNKRWNGAEEKKKYAEKKRSICKQFIGEKSCKSHSIHMFAIEDAQCCNGGCIHVKMSLLRQCTHQKNAQREECDNS